MSREPEHSVQTEGFWIFGFLSVVLAVLKLTLAAYWSWWRVMLPLLAFLGHNALYTLTALISFCWLKDDEEESTSADEYSHYGYNMAALFCFLLFLDNLLRREEGQGWSGFWPCSGSLEVLVAYVVLSLLAHFAFWSRIVSGLNQERI
jgi:uncharacterized membrane protein